MNATKALKRMRSNSNNVSTELVDFIHIDQYFENELALLYDPQCIQAQTFRKEIQKTV